MLTLYKQIKQTVENLETDKATLSSENAMRYNGLLEIASTVMAR